MGVGSFVSLTPTDCGSLPAGPWSTVDCGGAYVLSSLPEPSLAERAGAADRRDGWAGLGVALFSFFSGFLAAGLLGGLYTAVRGLNVTEARNDLGFALVSSAGLWVGFLVIPLLWTRHRMGVRAGLGLAVRWVDLPVGVAVGLAFSVLTSLASSALLSPEQLSSLEDKAGSVVDRAQGPVASVVLVVSLCVVTPLAEEVFFRGLLLGSLQRVAPVAVALVVASMVFGSIHYDFEPIAGVVLAVQLGLLGLFGFVLCVLAHFTRRLGASIAAHAVFNAVTVIGLLLQR